MRSRIFRHYRCIGAMVILSLLASACSWIGANNYTLASGNTVSGSLIAPSANITLDQGSHVTGSVILLCCNLIANGEIDGDVAVLSGNVTLGPDAVLKGRARMLTGNFRDESGAYQGGTSAGILDLLPVVGVLGLFFILAFLFIALLLILVIIWARQRVTRRAPGRP